MAKINRQGKCTLWKQDDTSYTLRTSDGRWYQIIVYKAFTPQRITSQQFYPTEEYSASGTMLSTIPVHLKFTVFGLQRTG